LINANLHRQPIPLDSTQHRQLRLRVPVTTWSLANRLNAIFVAAAEFAEVCREFPIVFVRAGKEPDGRDAIAPIAVFGLVQNENLFVAGDRWRALYMPAMLRAYPFCIAQLDDSRLAVCVDMAHAGLNEREGQSLFDAEGQPAELLKTMTGHLEKMEADIHRTRVVGRRLLELELLREMRFDATLPDGVLGLIHLHWVSLGNMRRLVDWHVERSAAEPSAGAS
jgi:hypothetical protein